MHENLIFNHQRAYKKKYERLESIFNIMKIEIATEPTFYYLSFTGKKTIIIRKISFLMYIYYYYFYYICIYIYQYIQNYICISIASLLCNNFVYCCDCVYVCVCFFFSVGYCQNY